MKIVSHNEMKINKLGDNAVIGAIVTKGIPAKVIKMINEGDVFSE